MRVLIILSCVCLSACSLFYSRERNEARADLKCQRYATRFTKKLPADQREEAFKRMHRACIKAKGY